jgi:hypothetical protein
MQGAKIMKLFHAIAASSVLVLATVGAHAASFIGQSIDGVLSSNQTPGVTTQFTSPIVAPGTFDGVMQDVFGQVWDVNVQVLSNEVIIDWTGTGYGNIGSGPDLLAVDLSGYTSGPILKLESYSCTPTGFPCDSFAPSGPSISGLTSTPTSFDVSFDIIRSGETYVFGVPEPATWAMMGLGFAGLSFVGFRARRSAAAIG